MNAGSRVLSARAIEIIKMLKEGIYRTKKAGLTVEKHGGANIDHYIYFYLCFYLQKGEVGLYATAQEDYRKPYRENNIDLKGQIIKQNENVLEFYLDNKDTGKNMIFKGRIAGEELHLKYYHEDKPEEIFEDVFKYIGNGHRIE